MVKSVLFSLVLVLCISACAVSSSDVTVSGSTATVPLGSQLVLATYSDGESGSALFTIINDSDGEHITLADFFGQRKVVRCRCKQDATFMLIYQISIKDNPDGAIEVTWSPWFLWKFG